MFKFEFVPNLETAIPRKSKAGLLIFNHAFFIGKSDSMGVEIVICSRRWRSGGAVWMWFEVKY